MDREKVIKGLECHKSCGPMECAKECPYGEENGCQLNLCADALTLIKEQQEQIDKLKTNIPMF